MKFSKVSILDDNMPLVNVSWSGRRHIEKTVYHEQALLQSMLQFVSQQIVSKQGFPLTQ